jgi:hypothetical protein
MRIAILSSLLLTVGCFAPRGSSIVSSFAASPVVATPPEASLPKYVNRYDCVCDWNSADGPAHASVPALRYEFKLPVAAGATMLGKLCADQARLGVDPTPLNPTGTAGCEATCRTIASSDDVHAASALLECAPI